MSWLKDLIFNAVGWLWDTWVGVLGDLVSYCVYGMWAVLDFVWNSLVIPLFDTIVGAIWVVFQWVLSGAWHLLQPVIDAAASRLADILGPELLGEVGQFWGSVVSRLESLWQMMMPYAKLYPAMYPAMVAISAALGVIVLIRLVRLVAGFIPTISG